MKRTNKHRAIIICFFISATIVHAQPKWINYTNTDGITSIAAKDNELWISVRGGMVHYNLKTSEKTVYTRADGLATNDVRAVAIAPDGHVWAAGVWGYGLSEFDGNQWVVHYVTSSLWDSQYMVTDMAFDSDGVLWLATASGAGKFSHGTWTHLTSSISGWQSSSVAVDGNNNAWFGTYSYGAKRYNGQSWTTIDTSNSGIASNWIYDIVVDHQNRIWFANGPDYVSGEPMGGGISFFDGANWTVFDTSNSDVPSNTIGSLAVDANGNLWAVCSISDGFKVITKYDGTAWTLYDTTNSPIPKKGYLRGSGADNSGNVYFGTSPRLQDDNGLIFQGGGEVLKFDGHDWGSISISSQTLPYSAVQSMAVDQAGKIWSGTVYNGATMFDGENWHTYDVTNTPLYPSDFVTGIAEGKDGVMWFVGGTWNVSGSSWGGTFEGGVARFDGTEWATYNTSNSGLASNNVLSVVVDRQNNTWFSTSEGVSRFDGTTWVTYNIGAGKMVIDSIGNVWFAGGGLIKFDGANWTTYNTSNSDLPDNRVRDITLDADGNLWMIFFSRAPLCKFDGSSWTLYDLPPETGVIAAPPCLTAEGSDNIWVGTYGHGIYRFDGVYWTQYNSRNSGIGYDFVSAIVVDSYGNKWIAGSDYGGGVSVFNENGITNLEIPSEKPSLPTTFFLSQNYPNPFNPSTTIRFEILEASRAMLAVYDILGREVVKLVDQEMQPGYHTAVWDARDHAGRAMPTGIYIYRLVTPEFSRSIKMVLLR